MIRLLSQIYGRLDDLKKTQLFFSKSSRLLIINKYQSRRIKCALKCFYTDEICSHNAPFSQPSSHLLLHVLALFEYSSDLP